MWWSRGVPLLVATLLVAGCGFHPLYARNDQDRFDADLASIKVNTIADRAGQQLAITLRDALNPTGARVATRYTLDVQLATATFDIGLRPDGTASRSEFAMTAKFVLMDARANMPVLRGTTHSVSSYDVLTDDYATVVAAHSAEQHALREVGDDILTRLQLYLSKHRSAPAPS
jgi:LPS-assembly lipoprotein